MKFNRTHTDHIPLMFECEEACIRYLNERKSDRINIAIRNFAAHQDRWDKYKLTVAPNDTRVFYQLMPNETTEGRHWQAVYADIGCVEPHNEQQNRSAETYHQSTTLDQDALQVLEVLLAELQPDEALFVSFVVARYAVRTWG